MSNLTNLIEFKIGDKDFSFKLEETEQTKEKILSIINQVVDFTKVGEKKFLNSNDYVYIIFAAVNLARKTGHYSRNEKQSRKNLAEI